MELVGSVQRKRNKSVLEGTFNIMDVYFNSCETSILFQRAGDPWPACLLPAFSCHTRQDDSHELLPWQGRFHFPFNCRDDVLAGMPSKFVCIAMHRPLVVMKGMKAGECCVVRGTSALEFYACAAMMPAPEDRAEHYE